MRTERWYTHSGPWLDSSTTSVRAHSTDSRETSNRDRTLRTTAAPVRGHRCRGSSTTRHRSSMPRTDGRGDASGVVVRGSPRTVRRRAHAGRNQCAIHWSRPRRRPAGDARLADLAPGRNDPLHRVRHRDPRRPPVRIRRSRRRAAAALGGDPDSRGGTRRGPHAPRAPALPAARGAGLRGARELLRGQRGPARRPSARRLPARLRVVRAAAHLVHGDRRVQRVQPDRRHARARERDRADHVRRHRARRRLGARPRDARAGARDDGRARRLPGLELPARQDLPRRCRRVFHRLHLRGARDPARREQRRDLGLVRHRAGGLPDRRHAVRDVPARHGASRAADGRPTRCTCTRSCSAASRSRASGAGWTAACRISARPAQERRRGDRRAGDQSERHLHLHRANRRVAPRLWVHSLLCLAMAVVFYDNTYALLGCLAGYTLFYTSRYRHLVRFGQRQVRRVLREQGVGRKP